MTHRERMLATIYGESVDFVPFAPRMDLWYISNRERGSLPYDFKNMNIVDLAKKLDVACHAVRADYTLYRKPEEHLVFRGFGLDTHPDYPFRVKLDLPVEFYYDKNNFITSISTKAGKVTTHIQQTKQMSQNGISLPFIKSYPINSKDDLEAVAQVFDNLRVIPASESYGLFKKRIGEYGVAVVAGLYAASPMHLILHDLMPMDKFYYIYHDDRESLNELAKHMEPFFEEVLETILLCDAEVIYWGSNYDQNITWPLFFEKEISPWLKKVSRRVHSSGKLLLTHTDGENKDLLPYYPSCNFDIAESVCTYPMTKNTLAEIRKGMGQNITVWGGIPSIALLNDGMDDNSFERYLKSIFNELDNGKRLIFGVSDNVPPNANLDRLKKINSYIKAFGPI